MGEKIKLRQGNLGKFRPLSKAWKQYELPKSATQDLNIETWNNNSVRCVGKWNKFEGFRMRQGWMKCLRNGGGRLCHSWQNSLFPFPSKFHCHSIIVECQTTKSCQNEIIGLNPLPWFMVQISLNEVNAWPICWNCLSRLHFSVSSQLMLNDNLVGKGTERKIKKELVSWTAKA